MKNGDMPANPLPNDATGRPYTFMDNEPPRGNHAVGLTKREYFAVKAMEGMLASQWYSDFCKNTQSKPMPQGVAMCAIDHADALLAELEK